MAEPKILQIIAATGLSKDKLVTLRRLAFRKGVWSSLREVERGVINLTIRFVNNIRSPLLYKTLLKVVAKLVAAIKKGFLYKFEIIGRPIAERLSQTFYLWGNKKALNWKEDLVYVRHLGMNAYYSGLKT